MLASLRSKRPFLLVQTDKSLPDKHNRSATLLSGPPPEAQLGPVCSTKPVVPPGALGLAAVTPAVPTEIYINSILCHSLRVPGPAALPPAATEVLSATEVLPLEDAAAVPGPFVCSCATELFDQHKLATFSRSSTARASDDLVFHPLLEPRGLKLVVKDSTLLNVLSLHLFFLNISAWQLQAVLLEHAIRHADELANLPHAYQSRDTIVALARLLQHGSYTVDHQLYITAFSHLFNVRVQVLMMHQRQLVEHHIVACAPRPTLSTVTLEYRSPSSYALLSPLVNISPGQFASTPPHGCLP